jgi:hypothetical protein
MTGHHPFAVGALFVVLLAFATTTVRAQDGTLLIDGSYAEDNVCYSSTGNLRLGTLYFTSAPTSDSVPIFTALDSAPRLNIYCVHYVQTSTASATDTTCAGVIRTFLCSASLAVDDWTCEEIYEYAIVDRLEISRGREHGTEKRWRIDIHPGATSSACYPRTIQMVAIVQPTWPDRGNVALMVIVGVMLGCLAICVIAFAVYALRKHSRKVMMRGDEAPVNFNQHPDLVMLDEDGNPVPPQPAPPGSPVPGLDGTFAPQPLPIAEVRALYMMSPRAESHIMLPDGTLAPRYFPEDRLEEHIQKTMDDERFQTRRPSVYQRSFRERLDSGGVLPVVEWSPRDHPEAMDMPTVVPLATLERAQRPFTPRRYNPLYQDGTGGGEQDTTLICADCNAVVQAESTGKYCPVSGRRHY